MSSQHAERLAPENGDFSHRLPKLRRQRDLFQDLPDRDKEIVKELLDAFLTKRHIQQLATR